MKVNTNTVNDHFKGWIKSEKCSSRKGRPALYSHYFDTLLNYKYRWRKSMEIFKSLER